MRASGIILGIKINWGLTVEAKLSNRNMYVTNSYMITGINE